MHSHIKDNNRLAMIVRQSCLTIVLIPMLVAMTACQSSNSHQSQKPMASISIGDFYWNNELPTASSQGDLATVKRLIVAGIHVDSRVESGETALHAAALEGYDEIVLLLLTHGADPELMAFDTLSRPIHLAAWQGHLKTVQILTDADADINAMSKRGTPLYLAEIYKKSDVADYLSKHGAISQSKN